MSRRITHANPKGLELGTSEQQIVLAKDAAGAKKAYRFRACCKYFLKSRSACLHCRRLPGASSLLKKLSA